MDQQEIEVISKKAVPNLFDVAYQKTLEMNLPEKLELPARVSGLGKQTERLVNGIQETLKEKHGDQFPELMSAVVNQYWYDCWLFASNIALGIVNGSCEDDEIRRDWTTAKGYTDYHGWANTLLNSYWSRDEKNGIQAGFASKLSGRHTVGIDTALGCMSVYWFHQAPTDHAQGLTESAFNSLGEAYAGVALKSNNAARREAINDAKAVFETEVRSSIGRKGADAIHTETRNLKKEVEEFWRSNVDAKLANDTAADILARHFPLKHRTLSKYVSEFKKAVCQ